MNELVIFLRQIFSGVRFWVMVAPWEQALRVRAGRHVHKLEPSFHLRIPILDQIFKQGIRVRFTTLGRQTISTTDQLGSVRTVTLVCALGYSIGDIETLYRTIQHPEDTIRSIARAVVADHRAGHSPRLPVDRGSRRRWRLAVG